MSRTGLSRALAALVLSLTLGVVSASADSITFNFTGSNSLGTPGNVRTFSQDGVTVYASAWYLTSTSGNFQRAALGRWDGGLGVCNSAEEAGGDSPFNDCGNPAHTVDNNGQWDFVLFLFDQTVDPTSVRLNAFGDTDVSYWLGNVGGNLSGQGYLDGIDSSELAGLGFGARQNDNNGTDSDRTVSLVSPLNAYNALLIGTTLSGDYDGNDRFKLKYLKVDYTEPELPEVPEPGTIALLGLGLAGMAVARRRSARRQ